MRRIAIVASTVALLLAALLLLTSNSSAAKAPQTVVLTSVFSQGEVQGILHVVQQRGDDNAHVSMSFAGLGTTKLRLVLSSQPCSKPATKGSRVMNLPVAQFGADILFPVLARSLADVASGRIFEQQTDGTIAQQECKSYASGNTTVMVTDDD